MNSRDPWSRLASRLRRLGDGRAQQMPPGFDRRVLAALRRCQDADADFHPIRLLRQMAGVAATFLLISIAVNFDAISQDSDTTETLEDLVSTVDSGGTP